MRSAPMQGLARQDFEIHGKSYTLVVPGSRWLNSEHQQQIQHLAVLSVGAAMNILEWRVNGVGG